MARRPLGHPDAPTPLSGSFGPDRRNRALRRLYHIIFEADTPVGRAFDIVLILAILGSVAVVMLESIASVREQYADALRAAEWGLTVLFTAEYLLRLAVVDQPSKYARSFFGVIDLLAIVPTYISVLIPGAQYLLVVRLLRILRVFRVLKLVEYLDEAHLLITALRHSRRKISIFLFAVLTLVVIIGSLMYLVEGEANGFTSIPRGIYWAIVTLTTVGYGDISPQTNLGQAFAALVMILGYAIIAVPTGIVTAEITAETTRAQAAQSASLSHMNALTLTKQMCLQCGLAEHADDALFCRRCGAALPAVAS